MNSVQVKEIQMQDLNEEAKDTNNRNKETNIDECISTKIDDKMRKMSLSDSRNTMNDKNMVFIEENNPIQLEEWLVFLHKTMEEILSGEFTSLTQPSLTNIIVSPMRNSKAESSILCNIIKLLSIPFAMESINNEILEQIKNTYLEVKLIPNMLYSVKLMVRVKLEENLQELSSPNSTPFGEKSLILFNDDAAQCLDLIFTLLTHLVYVRNDFLNQLCEGIRVLEIHPILETLLSCKTLNSVIANLLAILTQILKVFPNYFDIVDKIVDGEKRLNFVEILRHTNPSIRERSCYLLSHLSKNSPNFSLFWGKETKETLEALVFDSIHDVRNAAEQIVEELKNKEFYK